LFPAQKLRRIAGTSRARVYGRLPRMISETG
jgi:hypothetical protein